MKRDYDLIRNLLLAVDAANQSLSTIPKIAGHDELTIGHHAFLLKDAGLIFASDPVMLEGIPVAVPICLTWAGHDFLDAMRSDTIWGKAKESVIKPVAGAAFDVLLEWLKAEARARLGIG